MLTVTALFTKTTGNPATGLTLAEIDLYLYRRTKVGGVVSAVWTAEHPTEEIGGGLYSKSYASDEPLLYEYFGSAQYTGVTVLDSNYALYGGVAVADKVDFKLASDGLDTISTTAPAGVASNFREMLVQTWRRLFMGAQMTKTAIRTYDDTNLVVVTSQTLSDDGTTQIQGPAT